MKVAAVQMAVVYRDKSQNLQRMSALAMQAKAQGATLVVFPELATTGYSFMSGEPSWRQYLLRDAGVIPAAQDHSCLGHGGEGQWIGSSLQRAGLGHSRWQVDLLSEGESLGAGLSLGDEWAFQSPGHRGGRFEGGPSHLPRRAGQEGRQLEVVLREGGC
jgi:hypothetical protein